MIYHLYDNNHQHLAMADSLEDLQNAALQAFQEDGLPFAYVRWSAPGGQHQELRVTAASLAAARRPQASSNPQAPSNPQVHATRHGGPQRSARQRANMLTAVAIFFFLLYLTSEFASIIRQ